MHTVPHKLQLTFIVITFVTGMTIVACSGSDIAISQTPLTTLTIQTTSMATATRTAAIDTLASLSPTSTAPSSPTATPTNTPSPTPSPTKKPTETPQPTPSATPLADDQRRDEVVNPPETPTTEPQAPSPADEDLNPPETRTVRIGLNGRNDLGFHQLDYQLIKEAGIETLKMMSVTSPDVFARVRQENPDIEFIVRLYDDRINIDGHPTPQEFVDRMSPIMAALQPYASKFEIGNEPNHFRRIEGWGPEKADAESFKVWFIETYDLLKRLHPWAELGFPALGTPDSVHSDRAWLIINQEAIERADWLGVHCYWQTNPDGSNTMFDEDHGLCFKYYHAQFPNKPIELTEFDNDNIFYNLPFTAEETIAQEQVAYFQELYKYPYLRSASSYIMSSPDSSWDYFVWRTEDGRFKPVVAAIGDMPRPDRLDGDFGE